MLFLNIIEDNDIEEKIKIVIKSMSLKGKDKKEFINFLRELEIDILQFFVNQISENIFGNFYMDLKIYNNKSKKKREFIDNQGE